MSQIIGGSGGSSIQEQIAKNSKDWWNVQHSYDSGNITAAQKNAQQAALKAANDILRKRVGATYIPSTGQTIFHSGPVNVTPLGGPNPNTGGSWDINKVGNSLGNGLANISRKIISTVTGSAYTPIQNDPAIKSNPAGVITDTSTAINSVKSVVTPILTTPTAAAPKSGLGSWLIIGIAIVLLKH